jgi:hypothetical protein
VDDAAKTSAEQSRQGRLIIARYVSEARFER